MRKATVVAQGEVLLRGDVAERPGPVNGMVALVVVGLADGIGERYGDGSVSGVEGGGIDGGVGAEVD